MTLALTERLSEIFGAIQAIPADPLVPASTAINTHFFKGMGQVSVLAINVGNTEVVHMRIFSWPTSCLDIIVESTSRMWRIRLVSGVSLVEC